VIAPPISYFRRQSAINRKISYLEKWLDSVTLHWYK